MNREEIILKTVEHAKQGEFGLTAVKVEMEAGLGRANIRAIQRNRNGNCVHCTRGQEACSCCGDESRRGQHQCGWCEGERGHPQCEECHGTGWYRCDDCEGTGRMTCHVCHGEYHTDTPGREWRDNTVCLDFLLEYLSQFGLARRRRSGEDLSTDERNDHYGKWIPKKPLIFSLLYSDGGDTEWTFTLMVNQAENAFLLRNCVDAFNALALAIRTDGGLPEINIDGAGMHMSLLNDPEGLYESEPRSGDSNRFQNYRKSMILLLPAVYFLGASDGHTRRMDPRTPQVSDRDKYSAVHYQGGALEFRVFDTCYQNAETILDNLIVMCKSLRYWSTSYKRNNLDKVTTQVKFGNNHDKTLERLYRTFEHIDLLNRGLRLLKPDYYSVTELKQQRNFKVNKRAIQGKLKEVIRQAEIEYKEYERQFGWEIVMNENNYINRKLEEMRVLSKEECTPAVLRKVRRTAKSEAVKMIRPIQPKEEFTKQKIDHHDRDCGKWVLQAEPA